ncbi:MAG: hypothetical protein KA004_03130 [Verrucomicrobiales bacterium]|nr:hypothetical protein [Verrucomicrobiales bacterium]
MSLQVDFTLRGRYPDVLTCIANLSNVEVFTPTELANRMRDTLTEAWAANNKGANLWTDPSITFLDPCTKSGVFLREITRRLTEGLAQEIPDLQKRVKHILTKQVFGIGITRITSLLARRSAYCSKHAKGKHSIAQSSPSTPIAKTIRTIWPALSGLGFDSPSNPGRCPGLSLARPFGANGLCSAQFPGRCPGLSLVRPVGAVGQR